MNGNYAGAATSSGCSTHSSNQPNTCSFPIAIAVPYGCKITVNYAHLMEFEIWFHSESWHHYKVEQSNWHVVLANFWLTLERDSWRHKSTKLELIITQCSSQSLNIVRKSCFFGRKDVNLRFLNFLWLTIEKCWLLILKSNCQSTVNIHNFL